VPRGYGHDIAAGVLLVEESGGRVTDPAGNRLREMTGDVVASNGHLHEQVLDMLKARG
jgi:myo-inositol-1(or 4)-monophosphatase